MWFVTKNHDHSCLRTPKHLIALNFYSHSPSLQHTVFQLCEIQRDVSKTEDVALVGKVTVDEYI